MALGLGRLAKTGEALATRLARHLIRWHLAWILGFTVLTALAVVFVTRLDLKSDFIELLPQNFQSVKDLRKIVSKVGGLGNLSIALQSANVKASERLADDLAAVLDRDFKDRILYYDYKIDASRKYYTDNAALFMNLDDLQEIADRVERRIRAEKKKANPLFVDLSGEIAADSKLDFKDIEDKYKKDTESVSHYIDDYFTGEDGKLLVMMVKPVGTTTNMPAMRKLIGDIEAAIARLSPTNYAPDMKVGFAGVYKISLEEFDTLKNDILGTALLCLALVSAAVLAFYRRLRALVFLGISCVAAVAWTFAITYFTIGYLNTVTAFLGAIIVGTGINYGIILLARYFEERRLGKAVAEAVEIAMRNTVVATFGAASTTAVSFGIFLLAEVKSFSQFGFIGGLGIVLIWLATYTLLPAIVILSERILPSVEKTGTKMLLSDRLHLGFLSWPLKVPRAVLAVFTAGVIAAVILFVRYVPNCLEYDMSNLRTKSSMESGTAKLDERISRLFDLSMTPAIILATDPEQGKQICDALEKKKKEKGDAAGIESCRSIYTLIPEQQQEKLEIIRDIRRRLDDKTLESLEDGQKKKIEDLRKLLPSKKVTFADLPAQMTRAFTDKEGHLGTFVFVYPRAGRSTYIAENLYRFTDDIRRVELPTGEVITSSGEAVIFADLLTLLKRDSPIATGASFLGVFLLVLVTFGSLRSSIFVASALIYGTWWMVGLMSLLGTKLNFFNFVALPMTFGIGVDYSINLYQRYVQEGSGSMGKVLRRTGPAVFLCSLTTIIGYFTLIIADSNALVSLGGLAILGEFTCLAAAMIGLPALVAIVEKRKLGKAAASLQQAENSPGP